MSEQERVIEHHYYHYNEEEDYGLLYEFGRAFFTGIRRIIILFLILFFIVGGSVAYYTYRNTMIVSVEPTESKIKNMVAGVDLTKGATFLFFIPNKQATMFYKDYFLITSDNLPLYKIVSLINSKHMDRAEQFKFSPLLHKIATDGLGHTIYTVANGRVEENMLVELAGSEDLTPGGVVGGDEVDSRETD